MTQVVAILGAFITFFFVFSLAWFFARNIVGDGAGSAQNGIFVAVMLLAAAAALSSYRASMRQAKPRVKRR